MPDWCHTDERNNVMSKTDHARPTRHDNFGRRQPRPAPRRQGTRHGVIAAARKEG